MFFDSRGIYSFSAVEKRNIALKETTQERSHKIIEINTKRLILYRSWINIPGSASSSRKNACSPLVRLPSFDDRRCRLSVAFRLCGVHLVVCRQSSRRPPGNAASWLLAAVNGTDQSATHIDIPVTAPRRTCTSGLSVRRSPRSGGGSSLSARTGCASTRSL